MDQCRGDGRSRTGAEVGAVVRLRGPDDVLGVLPWRLGFHPTESLVVVVLQGRRLRERLVMRLDLPPAVDDPAVALECAHRAARAGADAVVVVVYTEALGPGLPRRDLVDALADALVDEDVGLAEALLVRRGRRWSYLCDDPGCCPPEGVPLPDRPTPAVDAYAAEAVGRGGLVLPDREALRAGVEPSAHPVAVAARDQAWAGAAGFPDPAEAQSAGGLILAELRERFDRGERRPPPTHAEALLVALALQDTAARDALMTAALDDDADSVRDLLGQVARLVDDDVAAPVCTVLGWLAYSAGEGALALVAVERALRADPATTMARLLLESIDAMVPPAALRDVCRAMRADLDATGR